MRVCIGAVSAPLHDPTGIGAARYGYFIWQIFSPFRQLQGPSLKQTAGVCVGHSALFADRLRQKQTPCTGLLRCRCARMKALSNSSCCTCRRGAQPALCLQCSPSHLAFPLTERSDKGFAQITSWHALRAGTANPVCRRGPQRMAGTCALPNVFVHVAHFGLCHCNRAQQGSEHQQ